MSPRPDVLADGVALPTTATTLVTGSTKGSRVTAIHLVNSTGSAVSATAYVNGNAAADTLFPSGDISVPANGSLTIPVDVTLGSGDTLQMLAGTVSALTAFCFGLKDDGS